MEDKANTPTTITAIGCWHDPRQLPRMAKHECGGFDSPHKRTHAEQCGIFDPDDCPRIFSIGEAMMAGDLLPPMIGWISSELGEVGVIRKVDGSHRMNAALVHGLRAVPMILCGTQDRAMALFELEQQSKTDGTPSPLEPIDWRYPGDFEREYQFGETP